MSSYFWFKAFCINGRLFFVLVENINKMVYFYFHE